MWRCANCYETFEEPDCETFEEPGCIGDLNGTTCPFCESSLILNDYKMPAEHPMCPCIMNPYIDTDNNTREETPALSFDDMDKHEVLLIDLPLESIDVRPITYISDMNKRFLHTFIDADFVSIT